MNFKLPEDVLVWLEKQPKGGLNIYTCRTCKGHIVTNDRDTGVTPFMLGCRATEGCEGFMQSSMYKVFDQSMKPSHEWYRPASSATLSPAELEHVMKGGLLIREVRP